LRASGRGVERTKLELPQEGEKTRRNERDGKKGKKKQEASQEGSRKVDRHCRKNIFRVMFNEITPKAIKAAFEHPGEITQLGGRATSAPRAGPPGRLQDFAATMGQVRRGLSAGASRPSRSA